MSWKSTVTMVVLLGIVLGAAYYGWSTIAGAGEDDATKPETTERTKPSRSCKHVTNFKKGQTIRADGIDVNVYNSGDLPGLAGDTLSALVAKGFKPGVAENAPEKMSARNVTIVTSDPESPEVRMVRIQFQGPVRVVKGELASGIDVLVGDDFRGVNPTSTTVFTLKKNIRSCTTIKD